MKLKIVYDNEARPGFERGWGFSCLVELEEEMILFDTGWDGNVLLSNLKKFGVGPEDIGVVVISHAHWDHLGGLPHIMRRDMEVYVPRSFSKHLKEELASKVDLHEVTGPQEIRKEIWSTGEVGEEFKEQSLILGTRRGLVVLVGCSHPGVKNILSVASKFGRISGIVGGMHGFKDYEVLKGLSLIVPTHCTVNKRKIAKLFPEAYVEGKAGLEIVI
ncbi:MAG TPA: MBL fold metallo-hydrolase [Hadesarchaea archaeon]|nr:MBL fold metallo-hydrolase [Hadesarchaea archaeon]